MLSSPMLVKATASHLLPAAHKDFDMHKQDAVTSLPQRLTEAIHLYVSLFPAPELSRSQSLSYMSVLAHSRSHEGMRAPRSSWRKFGQRAGQDQSGYRAQPFEAEPWGTQESLGTRA